MSALAINDLEMSTELDHEALAGVTGRGNHSVYLGSSSWSLVNSVYTTYKQFKGYRKLHGKWHRKYAVRKTWVKGYRKHFYFYNYKQV